LVLDIDIENLHSISLDISTFPHCTLEVQLKGEHYVQKVKINNHKDGWDLISKINDEWIKELNKKENT
jgi:hypothetical protein